MNIYNGCGNHMVLVYVNELGSACDLGEKKSRSLFMLVLAVCCGIIQETS